MKEFTNREMIYDMIKTLYETGKLSAKRYVEYVDMLRIGDANWFKMFDDILRIVS